MTHSIIPPSSAGIWGKTNGCTGWVKMSQLFPETESNQDALDGEASHWVCSEVLESYKRTDKLSLCSDYIGTASPNNVIITDEMTEGAQMYVKEVLMIAQEHGLLSKLQIEQSLKCPTIHDESFGTPDCFVFDDKNGKIYVIDYKFGHDFVEVFENWQMLNYLAGIVEFYEIDGLQSQFIDVEFIIIQPRSYHKDGPVRRWNFPLTDARGYFNILNQNAHVALSDKAICNSGSHCKNCPAIHSCKAALTGGLNLFEATAQPVPFEISDSNLGVLYALIKRAKQQITALETGFEEEIKERIKTGKDVTGWTISQSFGRTTWNKNFDDVVQLGQLFGKDLTKKALITPKQAIKLGIDESVINAYSSRNVSGSSLEQTNLKKVFS